MPDASGFCAFHLNPRSTKWHWVTLSIVPGAWQKKGLRPPEEVTRNANRSHLESNKKLKKRSNIDFLFYHFLLLLVGSGIILTVVVVLRRKIPRERSKNPFDLPSFLESIKKKQDYKNEDKWVEKHVFLNSLHPRSLTARPWKMVVGRLLSYWEGNFSGAMLNFGRVNTEVFTLMTIHHVPQWSFLPSRARHRHRTWQLGSRWSDWHKHHYGLAPMEAASVTWTFFKDMVLVAKGNMMQEKNRRHFLGDGLIEMAIFGGLIWYLL